MWLRLCERRWNHPLFVCGEKEFLVVKQSMQRPILPIGLRLTVISRVLLVFLKYSIKLIVFPGCINPIARCCSASEVFLETLRYRAEWFRGSVSSVRLSIGEVQYHVVPLSPLDSSEGVIPWKEVPSRWRVGLEISKLHLGFWWDGRRVPLSRGSELIWRETTGDNAWVACGKEIPPPLVVLVLLSSGVDERVGNHWFSLANVANAIQCVARGDERDKSAEWFRDGGGLVVVCVDKSGKRRCTSCLLPHAGGMFSAGELLLIPFPATSVISAKKLRLHWCTDLDLRVLAEYSCQCSGGRLGWSNDDEVRPLMLIGFRDVVMLPSKTLLNGLITT